MDGDLALKLPRTELDAIDTTEHVTIKYGRVALIAERFTGRTRYYWIRRRGDALHLRRIWPLSL